MVVLSYISSRLSSYIDGRYKLSTSDELAGKENKKRKNESLIQGQTVWHFRDIMTCLSNLLLYAEPSDPFLGAILTLAHSVELHYAYLTVTRLQA